MFQRRNQKFYLLFFILLLMSFCTETISTDLVNKNTRILSSNSGILHSNNEVDLNYTINLSNGTNVYLPVYFGKPLILGAFATWETFSLDQIEVFRNISQIYSNITILSVSVDVTDDLQDLKNYKENNNISWDVSRENNSEISDEFNIVILPTVLFFNTTGDLTNSQVGLTSYSTLEKWILMEFDEEETSTSNPAIDSTTSTFNTTRTINTTSTSIPTSSQSEENITTNTSNQTSICSNESSITDQESVPAISSPFYGISSILSLVYILFYRSRKK